MAFIADVNYGSRPIQNVPLAFNKMIPGGNGETYVGMNINPARMKMLSGYSGMGRFGQDDTTPTMTPGTDLSSYLTQLPGGSLTSQESPSSQAVDITTATPDATTGLINSLLNTAGSLGTAYTNYVKSTKAAVPVVASPISGIPTWVWLVGGVVVVGGAVYFIVKRKKRGRK